MINRIQFNQNGIEQIFPGLKIMPLLKSQDRQVWPGERDFYFFNRMNLIVKRGGSSSLSSLMTSLQLFTCVPPVAYVEPEWTECANTTRVSLLYIYSLLYPCTESSGTTCYIWKDQNDKRKLFTVGPEKTSGIKWKRFHSRVEISTCRILMVCFLFPKWDLTV